MACWESLAWPDEKKINLHGPNGFARYYQDLRKNLLIISTCHFGGGKVMIWACFCPEALLSVVFIKETVNRVEYKGLLRSNLLLLVNNLRY